MLHFICLHLKRTRMKHLFTLLLLLATSTSIGQTSWQQLPANPTMQSGTPAAYDIASVNGRNYVFYALMNSSSNNYDIHFDAYTVAGGWQSLEVYATDNNGFIDLKSVTIGSRVYLLANTNGGNHVTIFEISGTSVSDLETETFPALTSATYWNVYPGTAFGEVYFMYTNKLYVYDYNDEDWTYAGNPFTGSGVTPNSATVYVNQDSVFVVGRYPSPPGDKLRLRAASKSNWNWNNHTSGQGSVYSTTNSIADTMNPGPDAYFLYGDQQHSLSMIGRDNGSAKHFSVTPNSYGEATAFPLTYDNQAGMSATGTTAYMMARASNLTDQNTVYKRSFSGTSWEQVTASSFAPQTVTPTSKRIKTDAQKNRALIGYVANSQYILKLTNDAPTITDPGTAGTQLCSGSTATLLTDLIIEDLNDDDITLTGILSSNGSLIDPSGITSSFDNSGVNTTLFDASFNLGTVTAVETVTLTYTFTDGYETVEHIVTYTLLPSTGADFTAEEFTFCSNGDFIDLYDYVDGGNGTFEINETPLEGHYLDPTAYAAGSALTAVYYSGNGSCSSESEATITLQQAPTATITAVASTNCTLDNGTATLTLSGGTAPYQFTWNNGNNADYSIAGLSPGSVHADISDAAGCFTTADAIILNNGATITGTITGVSCYGLTNGAIDISVTGMTAPLSVLWSNGRSTDDVSGLQPGNHQVWITDAGGCRISQTFDVPEPVKPVLVLTGSNSGCGVATGAVSIETLSGGTTPYTYLWNTGSSATSLSAISSGIYTLTVTDANGCAISTGYGVSDNGAPYSQDAVITPANCNQQNGSVSVSFVEQGTDPTFTWSTGAVGNPLLAGLNPGTYTLHATNAQGCNSYQLFDVKALAPERQQICAVTVDSATSTNLLVWEKNGDPAIHHFNIYRETMIPGQFQWIDSVNNNNLSIFNDVVASPIDRSWNYRITAVDECSTESVPSSAHKTIHLTTTSIGGGSFEIAWNFYQGITVPEYNFYRYTTSTGWELVATLPATAGQFTDTPPNTDELDYMVEFDLSGGCRADYTKAQDFNASRSNKDKGAFSAGEGTGDSSNGIDELTGATITVYPNPFNDFLTVSIENASATVETSVYAIDGHLIGAYNLSNGVHKLDLSALQSGIYFIRTGRSGMEQFVKL